MTEVIKDIPINGDRGLSRTVEATSTDEWQWVIIRSKYLLFMETARLVVDGENDVDVRLRHARPYTDDTPGGDSPEEPWVDEDSTDNVSDDYSRDDDFLRGSYAVGFKSSAAESPSDVTIEIGGRSA